MTVTAESLAYWYLRLNGCLTVRNFIIHPEWRKEGVGGEADILAVRFPFRREMLQPPVEDEAWFRDNADRPLLLIAEVKNGPCRLNGPWMDPDRKVVEKVLAAIGVFPEGSLHEAAETLRTRGSYNGSESVAAIVAFGSHENAELRAARPLVRQVVWLQVKHFVHRRFSQYLKAKTWHPTWDKEGQDLYDLVRDEGDEARFCSLLEVS